jgi:hypothetical protein
MVSDKRWSPHNLLQGRNKHEIQRKHCYLDKSLEHIEDFYEFMKQVKLH